MKPKSDIAEELEEMNDTEKSEEMERLSESDVADELSWIPAWRGSIEDQSDSYFIPA